MSRLISVVTGSRADFGLLQGVIQGIENSKILDLELIVTGSHLSKTFGETIGEISLNDTTNITKIELNLEMQNESEIGFAVAEVVKRITQHFSKRRPSMCLVLGDRYEILGAAVACASIGVPLGHIHGGEVTDGSRDNLYRHAITKLAAVHFVAISEFKDRVVSMGENPEKVFVVGGLGVDSIDRIEMLSKSELEKRLKISIQPKYAVVTYHPDSIRPDDSLLQASVLMNSILKFSNIQFFITGANADYVGAQLNLLLKEFSSLHENIEYFESLGQQNYLSLIQGAQFVLGNSSSGLLEAPTIGVSTINVGSRQNGRPRAQSVINVEFQESEIVNAIECVMLSEYSTKKQNVYYPYGVPGASKKIVQLLELCDYKNLLPKKFCDKK